jgi:hypothetical protein
MPIGSQSVSVHQVTRAACMPCARRHPGPAAARCCKVAQCTTAALPSSVESEAQLAEGAECSTERPAGACTTAAGRPAGACTTAAGRAAGACTTAAGCPAGACTTAAGRPARHDCINHAPRAQSGTAWPGYHAAGAGKTAGLRGCSTVQYVACSGWQVQHCMSSRRGVGTWRWKE